MDGSEAERWGFYSRLCEPEAVLREAQALAKSLADGPTFAHAMTKRCIHQEWNMGLDEAIEAEAQAQAICMQSKDFERAYEAFVAKGKAGLSRRLTRNAERREYGRQQARIAVQFGCGSIRSLLSWSSWSWSAVRRV